MSETEINAALAGTYGVPVALVTGDDKCCEQAAKRLPGVRTVAMKTGIGRHVASSLSPQRARDEIREAAYGSVRWSRSLDPFRPEPPFTLEADLVNTACTELCTLAPGTDRTGPRTVRFETEDFAQLYRCLLAWLYLGRHAAPRPKLD
ncbi:MAG: M55 family metallopeptidase [Actinomycetota bacterium]